MYIPALETKTEKKSKHIENVSHRRNLFDIENQFNLEETYKCPLNNGKVELINYRHVLSNPFRNRFEFVIAASITQIG